MEILSNNSLLVFAIAIPIAVFALVMVIALMAKTYLDRYHAKIAADAQLKEMLTSELGFDEDDDTKKKSDIVRKWNRYWETRLVNSGVNIAGINRYNAGKAILVIDGFLFVFLTFFLKGVVLGALIITVALTALTALVLGFKANKKQETLSGQVPAFLSALRAANETNGAIRPALLQAIATTPDELHDELKPVEDQITAGSSVKQAIAEFYDKTTIDELRFLMACIMLVCDVGKDLTEELEIISDVVDKRMEVSRHLKTAVSSIMPTVWVATIMLPGLFLYTYIAQPISRQFWFHGFLSWIVLFVIIGLYALGMWTCKHLIDKIKAL